MLPLFLRLYVVAVLVPLSQIVRLTLKYEMHWLRNNIIVTS